MERPRLQRNGNGKDRFITCLLDSGAFSAWLAGQKINIDDYIRFIKDHAGLFEHYVNLDVIPGDPGHLGTAKQVEESARLSYENLQYMKSRGLSPIPVFHQGERFYWLERMLSDGEPYIGISPKTFRASPHQYRKWLDEVYSICTDGAGRATVKTHGFGVTAVSMLFRYPFYSVDSITWRRASGLGTVQIPPYENGKPCYTRLPMAVSFAGRKFDARSYWNLGSQTQSVILRWLEEEVGVTLTEAVNDPDARAQSMLVYLRNLGERLTDVRFGHRKNPLYE